MGIGSFSIGVIGALQFPLLWLAEIALDGDYFWPNFGMALLVREPLARRMFTPWRACARPAVDTAVCVSVLGSTTSGRDTFAAALDQGARRVGVGMARWSCCAVRLCSPTSDSPMR